MSSQLSQILDGWANLLKDQFNLLDPLIKQEAEKRLELCNKCPLRNNNTCSKKKNGLAVKTFYYNNEIEPRRMGYLYKGCGCNLSSKAVSPTSSCPLGIWTKMN